MFLRGLELTTLDLHEIYISFGYSMSKWCFNRSYGVRRLDGVKKAIKGFSLANESSMFVNEAWYASMLTLSKFIVHLQSSHRKTLISHSLSLLSFLLFVCLGVVLFVWSRTWIHVIFCLYSFRPYNRSLMQLKHSRICELECMFIDRDMLFIQMPYYENGTLGRYLTERLNAMDETRQLFQQLIQVLFPFLESSVFYRRECYRKDFFPFFEGIISMF